MNDLHPVNLDEAKKLSENSPNKKVWILEEECLEVIKRKDLTIEGQKARIEELEQANKYMQQRLLSIANRSADTLEKGDGMG